MKSILFNPYGLMLDHLTLPEIQLLLLVGLCLFSVFEHAFFLSLLVYSILGDILNCKSYAGAVASANGSALVKIGCTVSGKLNYLILLHIFWFYIHLHGACKLSSLSS